MELPSSVYYIIGIIVVANIGTIFSVLAASARVIWWLSKLDSRIEKAEHDVNAAHEKIRFIKTLIITKGELHE